MSVIHGDAQHATSRSRACSGTGRQPSCTACGTQDISPEYLVEHRRHDEHLLLSGERLIDLVELVRNSDGSCDWFLTNKTPITGADGAVVGLVGVTRGLTKRGPAAERLMVLTPAVEMISREFARPLTVAGLAAEVSMSASHFSRTFKGHVGVTPHRYLRRVRQMAACDLLSTTDLPMSVIASRTGFYDQSHLSNEFIPRSRDEPGHLPHDVPRHRPHRNGRAVVS